MAAKAALLPGEEAMQADIIELFPHKGAPANE
jgi:hypothetical protein